MKIENLLELWVGCCVYYNILEAILIPKDVCNILEKIHGRFSFPSSKQFPSRSQKYIPTVATAITQPSVPWKAKMENVFPSWWLNQPIWKNMRVRQIGSWNPDPDQGWT